MKTDKLSGEISRTSSYQSSVRNRPLSCTSISSRLLKAQVAVAVSMIGEPKHTSRRINFSDL